MEIGNKLLRHESIDELSINFYKYFIMIIIHNNFRISAPVLSLTLK